MTGNDAGGWREHTVRPYEDGRTVEEILARSLLLPPREVQRLGRTRGVRLNRARASLSDTVRHTDVVAVRIGEAPASGIEATPMPLAIVHEDDHVLVLDKPPFLLVHPTEPGQCHTLVNGIAHYYREQGITARIHPVHRLDRDTSGLVLIAKTPEAHRQLSAQLTTRALKREYVALVSGEIRDDAGTVDAPIARHPTQPVLRAVRHDGEGARTHFRVLERFSDATLVGLELETGRTHQIRVHMAHLGHPLLGDRQCGRRGGKRIGRQALHAVRISFVHPGHGERVGFEAPLPDDIERLRAELRRGQSPYTSRSTR
jgi:23S rRNA pseudouridine1911/1915/1917 synthase